MATTKNATEIQYQPLPDDEIYHEAYANNVYFEHSAWDLKFIFGQLDQRDGKIQIRQHTAITMPWAQIKILSYWLRGHLEVYEATNGKIRVPVNAIPAEPIPPTDEQRQIDPSIEGIYKVFVKFRNEFIENQKD